MIVRKISLFLYLVMSLPQALASNDSSSAITMNTQSTTLNVTNQQVSKNPFSDSAQNVAIPLVPSLIIEENNLLSQEIQKWVTGNGYKLFWNSKKDYLVYNRITLSGKSDDEILQALGELFFSENYGLVVKKYQKNRVIVIDEM
ncbi:toxin co-regulated pilus biosynthesis Q family protein [Enterobacter sichuanensis]|uniref:toxin co-regulated pilus biosynthesis Q family protein n=1 Tax=Enterobacter sichuanensis TaxID=2071710 RepID=UPI0021D123A5|nr:toxin co-regulated pilus biosynthesis Q family protein [Enterobacter sichuanensis]MCU6426818.1 toxin co-regulated pilus biosynthesis Q family protein [Enterobacter sichuanensis]